MTAGYEILHRLRASKFLIRLEPGKFAFLGYRVSGSRMFIESTYTPPEYRGRGIAASLMKAALNWARQQGLKVVPVCSYALYYLKKHREEWDVLDPDSVRKVEEFELERRGGRT